ncbi:MAG: hypothetical protein IJ629_00025 [Clostridia bacterium]|nr:hypothetical protein [Clostridia bacterium]
MGKEGENSLIHKIDKIENGYLLVKDFTNRNSAQNPMKAIQYVKDNFEYIGNINSFEVYYKR